MEQYKRWCNELGALCRTATTNLNVLETEANSHSVSTLVVFEVKANLKALMDHLISPDVEL